MKRVAVFLDRDGTVIEDTHYPRDPAKVKFLPGVISALKQIQENGYLLFIISNQSGVGRGIIQDHEFQAVHDRLCMLLEKEGIHITEFAYCFHKPEDRCRCRKPEPKLIEELIKSYEIDSQNSFMVGDKICDVELGNRVGTQSILIGSEEKNPQWNSFSGWDQVVQFILQ